MLLITSASSSSACATCCLLGRREHACSTPPCAVKVNDSVASMIAPANASPNDSPNDPAAEFTPAASLTRSSEIGDSV